MFCRLFSLFIYCLKAGFKSRVSYKWKHDNSFSTLIIGLTFFLFACSQKAEVAGNVNIKKPGSSTKITATATEHALSTKVDEPATILARKEVPVLCYHQIRSWNSGESKSSLDIVVPVNLFKAHLKILADSGYHTILPDQLYDYFTLIAKEKKQAA
ncbi:MAG: putative xylanase/chitin deacetylase [Segetibacter sp.]|nr:putative xylanase/chitin deacetylase [Segetibacter sp.]